MANTANVLYHRYNTLKEMEPRNSLFTQRLSSGHSWNDHVSIVDQYLKFCFVSEQLNGKIGVFRMIQQPSGLPYV